MLERKVTLKVPVTHSSVDHALRACSRSFLIPVCCQTCHCLESPPDDAACNPRFVTFIVQGEPAAHEDCLESRSPKPCHREAPGPPQAGRATKRSRGHPDDDGIAASAVRGASGLLAMTSTFMVRGEPVAHGDSEERSDEESGWGKAQINQPPPRSLAALGMTPLLYRAIHLTPLTATCRA